MLSSRETEVLLLMASGYTNEQIASKLYLSLATVKTYSLRIFDKLGAHNRAHAVVLALKQGAIGLESVEEQEVLRL